ncbi:hypothetical protein BH20ACT7_BH20ACT7_01910 [soil metagenome]
MEPKASGRVIGYPQAVLAVAVACALFFAWLAIAPGSDRLNLVVDNTVQSLAGWLGAGACAAVALRASRRRRSTWLLLAASAAAFTLGQAAWNYYELVVGITTPFPSLPDIGFLAARGLAVAALMFAAVSMGAMSRIRCGLDALMVATSLLLVTLATSVPSPPGEVGSMLGQVVALGYSFGDIAVLSLALTLLSQAPVAKRGPLLLLVAHSGVLVMTNTIYAHRLFSEQYATGSLLDVGWMTANLLLALAALHPGGDLSADADERSMSELGLALPYVPVLAGITVAGFQLVTVGRLFPFMAWTAIALGVILVARHLLALGEHLWLRRTLQAQVQARTLELRGREDQLRHQANHDSLTDLPNRTLLLDRLQQVLLRRQNDTSLVAVLLADLDGFKDVNDSLGHAAGDRLLRQVATRMRACLRAEDTLARIGGDEFTVLCPDLASEPQAVAVAERLGEALGAPLFLDGHETYVTASIGIAIAGPRGCVPDELLRDADAAMYQAKERGTGQVQVFTQALHVRAESRLQTAAALRRAVADEQLRVVYQPVVSLRDGTIKGIEALVRWEHPERGLLGPGDFIEVAEDTGLIVGVGLWVLQQACCQLTEWNAAVPNLDVNIAVNLSARQLVEPSLPQRVAETIESCGLEPRRLVLEITESALVRDVTTAAMVLHALKELGVILAIDDFGTGFSSLNYLKRFPVDVLKIDRSFVNGLGVDPEDGAIVAAVRALGGALGLDVVAEGVETELQAAKLLELDCPYARGYLFGRPVPAAALLPSLLRSSRASTLVGAAGTTGATGEGLGPLGGG